MDNSQTALKEGTEAPVAAPTTETEAPKAEVEEKVEVATEAQSETKTEDGDSNKSANARIRELNAKLKEKEELAQSLAEKVAEYTGSFDPSSQEQNYVPQAEPGAEISPEQYQSDVARAASAIVDLKMKQKEVLDRVNDESRQAIAEHSKLNPSSEEFDKELSESISTATLAYISRNPTASVKKFVDSLMKPYERAVAKGVGEAQGELAKQVTQAALRPTTVRETEKKPSEMTIKELEQRLGVVN
jgi:hypothetical protein